MSVSETANEPKHCDDGNGNGAKHELTPCSCCMALAQVRMPWGANVGATTAAASAPNAMADNGKAPKPAKKTLFDLLFFRAPRARTGNKSSANSTEPSDQAHLEWDEELLGPRPRKLWQGLEGMSVTLFGIVLPAILFFGTCISMPKRLSLVLINHPLETLAELILVASLPIINYVVWSSLCKNKFIYSKACSAALGAAAASMVAVAAVSIAGMFLGSEQMLSASGTDFSIGFAWLAFLSLLGAAASGFIIYRIRATREFSATKKQVLLFSSIGALLALSVIAVAEARPWYVRYAEYMAVSGDKAQAKKALALLRELYPERELHMECADSRSAGLCGLFLPVKPGSQRNLYFAITGKPYSFHETNNVDLSSMPDDYVKNNIVGDEVKGLSLARSSMDGVVHPRTMSANIVWTLVFKNDTTQAQEARTELALPPGAVVNDVLAWNKDEMSSASFFASDKVEGVSGTAQVGQTNAANVSDLGHGRVLMHASPVPPEGEYKVAVSIVLPLKANDALSGSFNLPSMVASNFSLDGEHSVSLTSTTKMNIAAQTLPLSTGAAAGDGYTITGTIAAAQLKLPSNQISVVRPVMKETVAVPDRIATKMAREERLRTIAQHKAENKTKLEEINRLRDLRNDVSEFADAAKTASDQIDDIRRTLQRNSLPPVKPFYDVVSVAPAASAAPKHLVVVIDGSATIAEYITQIRGALGKLPKNVPTSVVVASQQSEELAKPVALNKALELLRHEHFVGGQDNVKTVIDAAELAGKNAGGAVLWLHGPQPATNREIYIIAKPIQKPAFYDLTLGTADTNCLSLFSNNPEIGPFEEVPHHADNLEADLAAFVACWKPGNNHYAVTISQTDTKPDQLATLTKQEENEVLWLWANKQCEELLLAKQINSAATIAAKYGFVSPVSYASIVANNSAASTTSQENGSSEGVDTFQTNAGSQTLQYTGGAAPVLQGATNGTIGPQEDAVVVKGVNTAGTVRVNNLANLEALLNIIANLGEVVLGLGGAMFIICGLIEGSTTVELMGQEIEVTRTQRILAGATMIVFGLFTPAVINFFVASARDANLFS